MVRYGGAVASTPKPSPKDELPADQPGTGRMRGPKRKGNRTTLRVPTDLSTTAWEYAEFLGTTPNDALIRLAERGADLYRAERQVERIAGERRAAVFASTDVDPGDELPPPELVERAILSLRNGE